MSATVTAPLPLTSPTRTRNETEAAGRVPPAASVATTLDRATVTVWALATAVSGIDISAPLNVTAPRVAVPAVTVAVPAFTGWSNLTTIVIPGATERHSMPPAPV